MNVKLRCQKVKANVWADETVAIVLEMARGVHFCANISFFVRPASLYGEERVCVYMHISDCIETVYELPLLPNNTAVKHFYPNRKRREVFTGYLSLGRRLGGDWTNM